MAPALVELAAAVGQRLLLQAAAPSPAGEEAAAAASPTAAPAAALAATNTSDGGYQARGSWLLGSHCRRPACGSACRAAGCPFTAAHTACRRCLLAAARAKT